MAPVFGLNPTPKKPPAHLYFIQPATNGPIKIGAVSNVRQRMANMQTRSPEPLHIVGHVENSGAKERSIYKRLAHLRRQGDWFSPAQELVDFINDLHN